MKKHQNLLDIHGGALSLKAMTKKFQTFETKREVFTPGTSPLK